MYFFLTWVLSEVYNHLHCLNSVELQVVLGTPGRHVVDLPPVGGLIPTRDESNDDGVVRELQELDRLVTGGAAVGIQREEQRGKNTALGGTDGPGYRYVFSQPHVLPPVRQEVCDPPASRVRHAQLDKLVL